MFLMKLYVSCVPSRDKYLLRIINKEITTTHFPWISLTLDKCLSAHSFGYDKLTLYKEKNLASFEPQPCTVHSDSLKI